MIVIGVYFPFAKMAARKAEVEVHPSRIGKGTEVGRRSKGDLSRLVI